MSGTRESTHAALDAAKARMRAPEGDRTPGVPPWQAGMRLEDPDWSWSYDGRLYHLRHRGLNGFESVGTLSLLPGHIEHEGRLMDDLVELINTKHKGD